MRKARDKNKLKVNKGLIHEKEYKQHKNKTRQMMSQARDKYYKELLEEKKRHKTNLGTPLGIAQSKT